MADILERGDIFFLYRPKLDVQTVRRLDDVQRFYMVLKPERKKRFRRIIIGRKRLPDIGKHERTWGFVDRVTQTAEEVEDDFDPQVYETKTRGERVEPPARPVGEGIYVIARHDDHTHLAYALEVPETPGEAQRELNIRKEASLIVTVKNPDVDSPPEAGLARTRKAAYPHRLKSKFGDKRFVDLDPPDFLDYPGTELVLVGASFNPAHELGLKLRARRESERADIFTELKMERDVHPAEPLLTGKWA
ncbi:MAG TPA: hypothetical protein VGQ12_16585 [Candidatus Angelobacter sp.]|jgi:hypothetical protein|nr:hypothetical protein [Candidatus Angelobacter sp.]